VQYKSQESVTRGRPESSWPHCQHIWSFLSLLDKD